MVMKMVKCPICEKGTLHKGEVKETMFGFDLGTYTGEICSHCKETFLDDEIMRKVEEKAKEKGIWGLADKIKIVKSGNSLVLRIPAKLIKFLKLDEGKEVMIHPEGEKKIVVDIV